MVFPCNHCSDRWKRHEEWPGGLARRNRAGNHMHYSISMGYSSIRIFSRNRIFSYQWDIPLFSYSISMGYSISFWGTPIFENPQIVIVSLRGQNQRVRNTSQDHPAPVVISYPP